MKLAVILLAVNISATAFAQAGEMTVPEMIERATFLENDLEYEQAGALWSQVISDERATDEQKLQANLRAGIVQRIAGNDVDARLHFIYVLEHDVDTALPEGLPPKISTFFELVRTEVRRDLARKREIEQLKKQQDQRPPPPAEGLNNAPLFWSGVVAGSVGAAALAGGVGYAGYQENILADKSVATAGRSAAAEQAKIGWAVAVSSGLVTIAGLLMVGFGS